MAVILLESKQSAVWSKVCGLSRPTMMAAAESKESHKAVGDLLLPSLSPFVAGSLLWLPIFAHQLMSQYGPAVLPLQLYGFGGLSGGGNSPLPGDSLNCGSSRFLQVVGKSITIFLLPFSFSYPI